MSDKLEDIDKLYRRDLHDDVPRTFGQYLLTTYEETRYQ